MFDGSSATRFAITRNLILPLSLCMLCIGCSRDSESGESRGSACTQARRGALQGCGLDVEERGEQKNNVEEVRSLAFTEFTDLLATLHGVCTNTCDRSVCEFLSRIESILEEADGKSRGELMVRLKCAIDGCGILELLENVESDVVGASAVHGYYRTLCGLADVILRCGGDSFGAAEVDLRTYKVMVQCRNLCKKRGWRDTESTLDCDLKHWMTNRCDSPNSNFCRAHRDWEEHYRKHYEERIRNGETRLLKLTERFHRRYYNWAEKILRRPPSWGCHGNAVREMSGAAHTP